MEELNEFRAGPMVRIEGLEEELEKTKSKVSIHGEGKDFNPEKDLVLSPITKKKEKVEIEAEVLNYFGKSEEKINKVLRQVMEFDRVLHS